MTRRLRLAVVCIPVAWLLPSAAFVAARRRLFLPSGERRR